MNNKRYIETLLVCGKLKESDLPEEVIIKELMNSDIDLSKILTVLDDNKRLGLKFTYYIIKQCKYKNEQDKIIKMLVDLIDSYNKYVDDSTRLDLLEHLETLFNNTVTMKYNDFIKYLMFYRIIRCTDDIRVTGFDKIIDIHVPLFSTENNGMSYFTIRGKNGVPKNDEYGLMAIKEDTIETILNSDFINLKDKVNQIKQYLMGSCKLVITTYNAKESQMLDKIKWREVYDKQGVY